MRRNGSPFSFKRSITAGIVKEKDEAHHDRVRPIQAVSQQVQAHFLLENMER